MIHRPFQPPEDRKAFEAWLEKAKEATDHIVDVYKKALAAGGKPKYDFEKKASIWRDLKPHLVLLFQRKCAYCESKFEKVDVGDVEHFRPKGRVDKQDLKKDEEHVGYYWLAFDHMNLLISCGKCNKWGGKRNRFPIEETGIRAKSPLCDLSKEVPLLLNPYHDHPERDLEFDIENGMVRAMNGSDKGAASIEIYGLNREPLMESRRDFVEEKWLVLSERFKNQKYDELIAMIEAILDGKEEYSAMLRVKARPLEHFLIGLKRILERRASTSGPPSEPPS
jgi:uncharacterized protein (TIGR02646 family)